MEILPSRLINFNCKTILKKNNSLKITTYLAFFISILFTSCALRPIPTEHVLVQMEKEQTTLDNLGSGKILIYNDANILHTGDNTSQLNIKMDGKNLGQLRA